MHAETSLAICSMLFGGVFDRFPRLLSYLIDLLGERKAGK